MKRKEVTPQVDNAGSNPPGSPTSKETDATIPTTTAEQQGPDVTSLLEMEILHKRLQQRDAEIRILLRLMKQERKRADRAEAALNTAGMEVRSVSPASPDRLSPLRLARSVGAPTIRSVSTMQSSLEGSLSVAEDSRMSGSELGGSVHSWERVNAGGERVNAGGSSMVEDSKSSSGVESAEWKAALKAGTYANQCP